MLPHNFLELLRGVLIYYKIVSLKDQGSGWGSGSAVEHSPNTLKALGKPSHLFVYMTWYKVEYICIGSDWQDCYKNLYVWAQTPIKVVRCQWESLKKDIQREGTTAIFSSIADGYVDSIEDLKVPELILL